MSRYLTLRWTPGATHPYALEVGGTWLAHSAQRSGINVEAKLLLFGHAFDEWGGQGGSEDRRAQCPCASRDRRLGARFEGVLRSWQPSHARGEDGQLRDTAMHAVVAAEWPEVRKRLQARLT